MGKSAGKWPLQRDSSQSFSMPNTRINTQSYRQLLYMHVTVLANLFHSNVQFKFNTYFDKRKKTVAYTMLMATCIASHIKNCKNIADAQTLTFISMF